MQSFSPRVAESIYVVGHSQATDNSVLAQN